MTARGGGLSSVVMTVLKQLSQKEISSICRRYSTSRRYLYISIHKHVTTSDTSDAVVRKAQDNRNNTKTKMAVASIQRATWLIATVTIWAAFTLITMFLFFDRTNAMPPPDRTLKVSVEGQTRIKTARREFVANAQTRFRTAPKNTRIVQVVASKSRDFSYCGGFSLKLRGKTINRRNFRPTVDDAVS